MYSEEIWKEWSEKENKNYLLVNGIKKYKKKGYTHLDNRFWFPDRKNEIKRILHDELKVHNAVTGKLQWHSFTPFIRILLKTPRYRYQEELKDYDLECKIRPICFASHIDTLIFSFYSFALNKKYEDYLQNVGLNDVVLAYRPNTGKSNIQYAKEIFEHVKNFNVEYNGCTAIALDIKGYFDNIDHSILEEKWIKIIGNKLPADQYKLFEILTQYTYINKNSLYKKYDVDEKKLKKKKQYPATLFHFVKGSNILSKYQQLKSDRLFVKNKSAKGIPQGSAISALLSNIYLIDYDETLNNYAAKEGFIYRRYCDDILIICKTEQANALKDFAIKEIKNKYLLTIQKEKAEVFDFIPNSKGIIKSFRRIKQKPDNVIVLNPTNEKKLAKKLQYLGFEFDGVNAFIRSSSLSRYFRKMKARLDKTVRMAYSQNAVGNKVKKTQIFNRYTHLGNHNFISYALRAASQKFYSHATKEWKEGLNSPAIKRQINRHFSILEKTLDKKNDQRYFKKLSEGKVINKKKV